MRDLKLTATEESIIKSLSPDDQAFVNKMLANDLLEEIFSIPLNRNFSYGMGEENENKFLMCADLVDAQGVTHRFLFASRKEEGDFLDIQYDVYHLLDETEHGKLICFCAKSESASCTVSF